MKKDLISYMKQIWVSPKNGGKPPKWMVKIMENPIKMDDLGESTLFLETPIWAMDQLHRGESVGPKKAGSLL